MVLLLLSSLSIALMWDGPLVESLGSAKLARFDFACLSLWAHLLIFSSSHLLIFTSSHLHICSSSHLLIFTSAHLHIFSSSHLLIFTSSHLHIFSSSHLLIFTSSHLHICSSSHLLIFTSSHLHICSSSHLLIFTSSHTHIFSFSLSHSHLHILTSSLSLSPLSSLLSLSPFYHSFLSPFSLSRLLYLSLFWPRVVPAGSHETSTLLHEMRVDAQKLRKNCDWSNPFARNEGRSSKTEEKLRIYLCRTCPGPTLSHEMRVDAQKRRKIAILLVPEQPFRTKWRSIVKNWGKIANLLVPDLSRTNPFARNEGRCAKTKENCNFTCPGATLSHEMRVDRQKLRKNCEFTCAGLVPDQPFRTKWGPMRKNWGKIAILLVPEQPFRTKRCSMCKNRGKIAI